MIFNLTMSYIMVKRKNNYQLIFWIFILFIIKLFIDLTIIIIVVVIIINDLAFIIRNTLLNIF